MIECRIWESEDGARSVTATMTRDGVNVNGHVYVIASGADIQELRFQLGPVKEAGNNGMQTEQVIVALINRLDVLNMVFPCAENDRAIQHLTRALGALNARTLDRQERGVEGQKAP